MDLYYSPMTCALASHIVCLEAQLPVTLHRVDRATHFVDGDDFFKVHPMGKVPALVCDDGRVLTENVAVLLFLRDRADGARGDRALSPASFAYYDLVRWLSFVATELHKQVLAPLFLLTPAHEAVRQFSREAAARPLAVLEQHLAQRPMLLGDDFTVADAYLFWALTLLPHGGIPLERYPALRSYRKRLRQRPAFDAALRREQAELTAT
jgi:glutathione S-transferase